MSKFRINFYKSPRSMDRLDHRGFSSQRTTFIEDENGVMRNFVDGQEFEGSNFWKKYAYPNCELEISFIEVIEEVPDVPKGVTKFPAIFNKAISGNTKCSDAFSIDIKKECKGIASSTQITNRSSDNTIKVKFNKDDMAVLELLPGETQTFGKDDFDIYFIDFINNSIESVGVQVVISVVR